jgi:hypothetical protein
LRPIVSLGRRGCQQNNNNQHRPAAKVDEVSLYSPVLDDEKID